MSDSRILITGGAGFIGTHLTFALSKQRIRPIIVDCLDPQVHGNTTTFPASLLELADCLIGDITDAQIWNDLGKQYPDIDTVIHLAALTGTGQSMFDCSRYDRVNSGGTATLAESIALKAGGGFGRVSQVILASSRAVYGEGAYFCESCSKEYFPELRDAASMASKQWQPICPDCSNKMNAVLTPEYAIQHPASFYGVTKAVQEQYLNLILGQTDVSVTCLRFQNVYGPGQSLKNPYTGVIGVFYSNLKSDRPIDIFEDGEVTRDFVYVTDVVDSIMKSIGVNYCGAINVGTGQFTRLFDVATTLKSILSSNSTIGVNGNYRLGDIRHNAADISLAKDILGFQPITSLDGGLAEYCKWAENEEPLSMTAVAKAADDIRSRS